MAQHIPETFVDELIDRLDIVGVISERVPLQRAGHEYKACCPFHDEKTPSFTVSPQKQFYHCFGCGKHGSAIGFVMDYDGLGFVDAVSELAHSVGLELPQGVAAEQAVTDQSKPLLAALEQAAVFYATQLTGNAEARRYLQARGLTQDSIERFQLGYAPNQWNVLQQHLGRRGFSDQVLIDAGLLVSKGDKRYDKFRHRIMFPIHDRRGRIIAFGGRALDDNGPKYMNSPETAVYHKGRELYGLFQARQRQRPERLLLVEGYMDVIMLDQQGLRAPVATSGTATTEQQARMLFQTTEQVICCFDGDRAGRDAAWKALQNLLPHMHDGRQVGFVFLPEGEDPDSMARHSPQQFNDLLQAAMPLSELLFRELEKDLHLGSAEGRAALVSKARPLLQRLPTGVYRDMLMQQLQDRTRHSLRLDGGAKSRSNQAARAANRPQHDEPGTTTMVRTPLRHLAALLVQQPWLAADLSSNDLQVVAAQKNADVVLELIDFCSQRPQISMVKLLEHWRGHAAEALLHELTGWRLLAQAVLENGDDSATAREQWRQTARDLLLRMQSDQLSARIRMLTAAQQQGVLDEHQKQELRRLLMDKQQLQSQPYGSKL